MNVCAVEGALEDTAKAIVSFMAGIGRYGGVSYASKSYLCTSFFWDPSLPYANEGEMIPVVEMTFDDFRARAISAFGDQTKVYLIAGGVFVFTFPNAYISRRA